MALPVVAGAEESAAGGIAPAVWGALRRAAAQACLAFEQSPDGEGWPSEELRSQLALLCDAMRATADGADVSLRTLSPSLPGRRLIDEIRRSFLGEVQSLDASTELAHVVGVLECMEHVQQQLDRDVAHRFANRLAGPDALDLIVEVAHDMRSPLGSILFLAERLHNGQSGPINPIQQRQLGLVYSAAFGLSSLASDVIELARGGDRLVDLHPIPFSVADIFQSVRDIVQPIAEEKGLTVRLTPPESDVRVGYPAALNRVLLNLTTNALKFTAEGFVEVTGKQLTRTRVEFSVRDTGRGIPPQVMATLFDAFRRRQKPGDYTFSSAGLGLSICQKLVTAMGGELKVDTAPERGTRFHFELELPHASKM